MQNHRVLTTLGLVFASSFTASTLDAQTSGYDYRDEVEGDWVSLNAVPVRPMVLTEDALHIYAVSTQANSIVHIGGGSTEFFATPHSPVSVALWDHDPMDGVIQSRIVVACRDSYVLALLDRITGTTVGLLELRDPATGAILGEPQDLLIDPVTDTAFVSCAAVDAVAEIDLATLSVTRVFRLPSKNPVFMCFDGNRDVLVAPMLSGNNSGSRRIPTNFFNPQHMGPTVVDYATQGMNGTRLPDEDLFRCVRSSGVVQAVTRDVGAIQFGVAVHPSTGDIWQLNTGANNKDPLRQGIDAIRGTFVSNRVSISPVVGIGQSPAPPSKIVDLDTTNAGFPYDPTRTVGQPYAMTFVNNLVAIAGLLTDNVMVLDAQGGFVVEFDLPDGSIPRGILYSPILNLTLVYCWGTNKIETFVTSLNPTHQSTIDLGFDPTPIGVKRGREIFYDASHSQSNNMTCVSCHVEGRMDQLVWNLGELPTDDKGPLLTQSLMGIEKVTPFHWRGERHNDLDDFNSAFVELQGASSPLSDADFADFEEFVYSLQNAPNPHQNETRVIDDSVQPTMFVSAPSARATIGQPLFRQSCEVCHNLPLGSGNDIFGDGAVFDEQNARRQRFRVPAFRDVFRREQDADPLAPGLQAVSIDLQSLTSAAIETDIHPVLGSGMGHAGLALSLYGRVIPFALTAQEISDITGFIHQWDSGIAPATYRATLLNEATHATASLELVNYLVPEADARNCDLVVYGTSTLNSVVTPMRWCYDRELGLFIAEDTTEVDQPLSFFNAQAQTGQGSNVFLGVPVGMGERIALDYDGDDLFNGDEVALGTDPFDSDTDEDGWFDGHEVKNGGDPLLITVASSDSTPPVFLRATTPMVTGKVARINVVTDEPCRIRVKYSRAPGVVQVKTTAEYGKTHSLILNDLLHSTAGGPLMTYTGTVTAMDLAGNTSLVGLPTMPDFNLNWPTNPPGPITTRNYRTQDKTNVIGDLSWQFRSLNRSRTGVSATARVRVDQVNGGPPAVNVPGHRVIARLFKNNVLVTDFKATGRTQKLTAFNWLHRNGSVQPYVGLEGPFLASPTTGAGGLAEIGFSLKGVKPGDELHLNIELIVEVDGAYSIFTIKALDVWSMGATPVENRGIRTRL